MIPDGIESTEPRKILGVLNIALEKATEMVAY